MLIASGILLKKGLEIMNKKIFVMGSISIDHTVFTKVMPTAGVTGKADSFIKNVGGKGANQAVASLYLGGDVFFMGAVGQDDEGRHISSFLKEKGLKSYLKSSNKTTGAAFITINESNGENQILIVQGANMDISIDDINKLEDEIGSRDIFLAQLETPIETVIHSIKLAKKHNLITILNPAPYAELNEDVYPYIDYFIPNEHELDQFVPENMSYEDKARLLVEKGIKNVIVTLGEKGSLLVNKGKEVHIEPFKVKAIDTTAAGDSYVGAFVTALSEGKDIVEAMKFASKCSSITVTRIGAISSLPTIDEIK